MNESDCYAVEVEIEAEYEVEAEPIAEE